MNLQDLCRTLATDRIGISAQELYDLCREHRDIVLETTHVLPPQGPTYEELVAATLKHCPQAVIAPRTRVAREWALDRVWEVSREEFDATHPNTDPAHWFDHKAATTWRARASVLESIAHCFAQYPNCVFYEHGLNVNGQPYKACRYGVLNGQTFTAFEY